MVTENSKSPCDEMADLLPLAAIGDVTVEEDLLVAEHLAGCEPCCEEMEACRRLCQAARRELAPVPAVPLEPGGPGRPWIPTRPPLSTGRLAAAAALLLAGIVLGRWSMPPPAPQARGTNTPATDRLSLPVRTLERSRLRPAALSVFSPAARPFLMAAARGGSPASSSRKTSPPRD